MNISGITFSIRCSLRARHARLVVNRSGEVTVILPPRLSDDLAERFVRQKAVWLRKKIDYFRKHPTRPPVRHTRSEYLKVKEHARRVITQLVEQYAASYSFRYRAISIRNQRTCWGSCSPLGNLNFNYRLLYLPASTREYIIVHELCHLQTMNHSKKFWSQVERILPDFRERKKGLRQFALR